MLIISAIYLYLTFLPFSCRTISLSFSPYPGVQILERTSVQQVLVEKGQVVAVETDRGSIECEYFVNCAGQVNFLGRLCKHLEIIFISVLIKYETGSESESKL